MKIVGLMLMRMVAVRFLAILLGISLFVLSLETVSYSSEILALRPGDLSIVPQYILYRMPMTLVTFLPISMLLAMLLTLTELSYRNEITALWAAGLSPARIVVLLAPLALLTGGVSFLLSDAGIPWADSTLREWGIADYGKAKLKVGEKDPIWLRSGPDILRAGSANALSTRLKDVIIFRRGIDGLLDEQIYAATAALSAGRWTLNDVIVYYAGIEPPSRLGTLIYSGDIKPAAAGARSGEPENMALADLGYFVDNSGFGIRPVWVYQTWWHKRLSLVFSTLLMISLCIPLTTRFRRGGGLGALFAAGVGLGFLYFVVDGISVTMGELGFVTPWLAAWLPIGAFGAVALAMTLRAERV
ncbi:MAG: LptF/LptG family permease [Rhizobiales bacterium]|nr:LptF/LptG family permease [Hyphomicrobiales bacterium]MBI3673413.1 LptF/LptG family permease [Hyphomicrobiales bacterium]